MLRICLLIVLGCLAPGVLSAQNLVPNPSFEEGTDKPDLWEFVSPGSKWENVGRTGNRGVSLTGVGPGGQICRTISGLPLQPNQTYMVRYHAMTTNALNSGAAATLEGIGGRRMLLNEAWSPYAITLVTPAAQGPARLLLNQNDVTGTQYFDDVEVRPCLPVHVRVGGQELGVGENLLTNRYQFKSQFVEPSGSYSRCLVKHAASFSGDDWGGAWRITAFGYVMYRHGLAGLVFTNARAKITVASSFSGDLIIEAGSDGVVWQEIDRRNSGSITPGIPFDTVLPSGLLSNGNVFVRLRATAGVSVSGYEFEGDLPELVTPAKGQTWFWEVAVPGAVAKPVAMANTSVGHVLTMALRNPDSEAREMAVRYQVKGPTGLQERSVDVTVPALATNEVELALPNVGFGENESFIEIHDQAMQTVLGSGSLRFIVTALQDDSFGFHLPTAAVGGSVWWCGSTYKVSRDRAVPLATNAAVQISAARNEYEPFQIVLRPDTVLSNATATISDFVASQLPGQPTISKTNVQIDVVEYVNVAQPTDFWGGPGEHPDPLIPLNGLFSAEGQSNQPLWFTVFVPKETPAGSYEATVNFQAEGFSANVPVRLNVFDFSLSDVTHTWTAYHAEINNQWHIPYNNQQQQAIWDLYLENFRRHRISPYAPHLYSPIEWTAAGGEITHDFTRFDAAMNRYLEEFNFTGFNVIGLKAPPLPKTLEGHLEFTPGYNESLKKLLQPIMAHLRERGWADMAYCYWIDEPGSPVYSFVSKGMKAIQNAAPGLRRMLTMTPESELVGNIDIWMPLFSSFKHFAHQLRLMERRAAGDTVGWYVAVVPTAPRPNNFIDHPAISHRIRFWAAETYGITNDLYWNTTWYAGTNGSSRDPWEDPMSISGAANPLGNGDGMLLYPPVKTPPTEPLIAGPINSLRWELLREGLEDAEYFWTLKEALRRAELRVGPNHPTVITGYSALAEIQVLAPSVSSFDRDPERLQQLRQNIASAIEGLEDGRPTIVRAPRSQAVGLGGSITLRAEALGWPLPDYQWQLDGVDLPNETASLLSLTNFGSAHTGDYTVVAYNSVGSVTSVVARVAGLWSVAPRIIADPVGQKRFVGENATMTATVIGSQPMSYFWVNENGIIPGIETDQSALLLTNVSLNQAGDYRLVASNSMGVVTSAVARLTVLSQLTNITLLTGVWRYHDQGQDLEIDWRQLAYDDSSWSVGQGVFAYGQEPQWADTLLNETLKPTTVYFRQSFEKSAGIGTLIALNGEMVRDDGVAIYLNGDEILRNQLPDGELSYDTSANAWVTGNIGESELVPFSISSALLQTGTNIIAVEVHQNTNGPPTDHLPEALWSFEETNSPWSDGFGNHEFVAIGDGIAVGAGKFGLGVFNNASASSFLMAADAPELRFSGPFTVGGWFRFGGGNSTPLLCLEKTNEFRLYYSGTSVNRYRFEVNGVSVQDGTGGTALGQWRFVVGWYDGTNINIQVDNGPVYSALAAVPPVATTNPLVALKLSMDAGEIAGDEMFFYQRVLTPTERASRYQNVPEFVTEEDDLSFYMTLSGTFGQKPQIISAPEPLTRLIGDNAAFTVDVASLTSISYQWHFKGTPLAGQTNRLLFLNNVSLADAGEYSVSISNVAGTTNVQASLTVMVEPELGGRVGNDGAGLVLEIPGYGVPMTILVSSNLVHWDELLQIPASFTSTNIVDPAGPDLPSRFYRLRVDE